VILICGDVHGDFRALNILINKQRIKGLTQILQCGDFGYWPKFHNTTCVGGWGSSTVKEKRWNLYSLKNKEIPIDFCDGNHEDHDALDQYKDHEILPNVFHHKRGSYITLEDGRNVLFMGGADSTDKALRTPGYDWFPQESISQKDFYNLPDIKIDIVISHTCPLEFDIIRDGDSYEPASRKALSFVLEKYKPALWYFGHFHKYREGYNSGCKWVALNHSFSGGKWWIKLDDFI
jgi:Icc-related predicted phosphoesterase